jgi:hypothetical protein
MPSAIDYMLVSAWYVKYVLGYWLANIFEPQSQPCVNIFFFWRPAM